MGLDASVRCRCFEEGRYSEPPFPIGIDEEGYPDLAERRSFEDVLEFDQWLLSACEHGDMTLACEWISNWGGYRAFQSAVRERSDQAPVLMRVLPNANGGKVDPEDSVVCLRELKCLANSYRAEISELVDDGTGEVIDFGGICKGGWEIGLDDAGVYIRRSGESEPQLRATHLQQQLLTPSRPDISETWFTNLDTGAHILVPLVIEGAAMPFLDGQNHDLPGPRRCSYPTHMRLRRVADDGEWFRQIAERLRTVFQASVDTGNPVRWS